MSTKMQINQHGMTSPPPLRGRAREGGQSINPPAYKGYLIQYAKELRTGQTDAESKLWYFLRAKRFCNLKFRRQQPIGDYIADFVCLEKKLVIELDGSQHVDSKSDIVRDNYFKSAGYEVLRYWNNDVLQQTESVLEAIYHHIFTPSPQPSPSRGEGDVSEYKAGVSIINFGCRLNVYEGQTLKDHAEAAGLENTIIFNSCAVTSEAERQVRQAIRKARKEHPNAKLVVTGCSAQIHPEDYLKMDEVDAVLGNHDKMLEESYTKLKDTPSISIHTPSVYGGGKGEASSSNMPPLTSPPQAGGINRWESNERVIVNDIMSVKETASHLVSGIEGHSRAFVQVQNGCDHRCTFCIIPYGRGNSRSVPAGEVVSQIRKLVEQGYKEVVLTGVDISDYGKYLPGGISLGKLCEKILKLVPELPRLRISSIDAVEVDETLYDLIAGEPRLMPHMHLSLQAGNDMILKRMKRRHLRNDILEFCSRVKSLRPDMVFGADIIAGFPTETEEMFVDTLNLVDEADLTYLHVFPYSEREGTPAAKMPQVAKKIRKERAARLRERGQQRQAQFYHSLVGTTQPVLIEQNGTGRTPHFAEIKCANLPAGEIVSLHISKEMLM